MRGGGGAREVVPIQKRGADKVKAMLKGRHERFLGSLGETSIFITAGCSQMLCFAFPM